MALDRLLVPSTENKQETLAAGYILTFRCGLGSLLTRPFSITVPLDFLRLRQVIQTLCYLELHYLSAYLLPAFSQKASSVKTWHWLGFLHYL